VTLADLWPGGTVPGFFVEAQGYQAGSCRSWAKCWDAWSYAAERLVPTPLPVMLGIRVHGLERDRRHWRAAVDEGLAAGYQVHLNFMLDQLPDREELHGLRQRGVILSYGNTQARGDGLHYWRGHASWLDEIQDDAGVRSAVTNARHAPAGVPVNLHVYGRDGVGPGHLWLLRRLYPDRPFRLGELHWTHRQHGQTRDDREDVYTAEAGAYCRRMVEAAAKLGMPCCLFTGRDFMPAETGGPWPASWRGLTGQVQAKPMRAPLSARLDYAKAMLNNAWGKGR